MTVFHELPSVGPSVECFRFVQWREKRSVAPIVSRRCLRRCAVPHITRRTVSGAGFYEWRGWCRVGSSWPQRTSTDLSPITDIKNPLRNSAGTRMTRALARPMVDGLRSSGRVLGEGTRRVLKKGAGRGVRAGRFGSHSRPVLSVGASRSSVSGREWVFAGALKHGSTGRKFRGEWRGALCCSLGDLQLQVLARSTGSTGSWRRERRIREKVIGHGWRGRSWPAGRHVGVGAGGAAVAIFDQPAGQHGGGVFIQPLIEEHGDLLAEVGSVAEPGQFIGLQRSA
jgi:hypothetical protein